MTDDPEQPPGDTEEMADEEMADADRRGLIAAVAVVLVLVVGGFVWWLAAADDEEAATTTAEEADDAESTTTEPTTTEPTTTEPTTTSEFVELSDEERAAAIFPFADHSQRFDDPVAAARAFAVQLAGFSEPAMGEFRQGDARSGEVEVRPSPDGPVTTVAVRQLGEASTWWVIAAVSDRIVIERPGMGQTVRSPVQLSGRSSAFEGTVEVRLHQDGQLAPIAEGFVTGGAVPELGPFEGELAFDPPSTRFGSLLMRTVSAEDGGVDRVTVQRVAFDPGGR